MENTNTQQYTVPKNHKKVLYVAAGCSLAAVVLLAIVLLGMFRHSQSKLSSQVSQIQLAPTQVQTQENQTEQTAVTPMPINNAQDVSNALQEINNSDPAAIGTGLSQNTSDVSQFSQ